MIRMLPVLLAVAILTSPLWIGLLALETSPRVAGGAPLGVDDVESVQRLLRENDPRSLRDGERRRVVVTEREMNLLFRYALPEGSAARVDLRPGLATVAASTPIGAGSFRAYLNLEMALAARERTLQPTALTIGRLHVPGWLAAALTSLGDRLLRALAPEYGAGLETLESLRIDESAITVVYRWRRGLLEQLKDRGRDLAISRDQGESILAYYRVLLRLGPTLPERSSLADVLGPLFAEALKRSEAGAAPAAENRAVLLALGMAIQGANPNHLTAPGEAPVPVLRRLPATLGGRRDLAQHFAVSAALAAGGGSRFADVVGIFKELSDARGGSGFSFPDLLADRAGVVLAERATGAQASQIQRRLAGRIDERVFMPSTVRLPEGLQDPEFRRRYDDLDSDAYGQVRDEVERRIAGLALYR